MQAESCTHIIWDFNGTLLDDVDVAVAAVSDMLQSRGRGPMTRQWYREIMDMPIIRYYEKLFDLSKVSFEQLSREFVDGYARHFSQARVMPGACRLIERFSAAGCRQVIISSFEQERLRAILRELGLAERFDTVLGAGNIRAESKIERATNWLRESGAQPDCVLVIGDLVHDWEMAQTLGARCVLLDRGHQSRGDLLRCGCPVVHNLEEIAGLSNDSITQK